MPYGEFAKADSFEDAVLAPASRVLGEGVVLDRGSWRQADGPLYVWCAGFNSIFPVFPSPAARDFIKRDTSGGPILKSLAMAVYRGAVVRCPSLLAEGVALFPDCAEKRWRDILIYPGNKKTKVIDTRTNSILNVAKNGYATDWMQREVSFRRDAKWDFVLPVEACSPSSFSEVLVVGWSLPRCPPIRRARAAKTIGSLLEVINYEVEQTFVEDYVSRLVQDVRVMSRALNGKLALSAVEAIMSVCDNIGSILNGNRESVSLVFSHGDFKAGNIMVERDSDRIFVIDWETYGVRSSYFDSATWNYNLRGAKLTVSTDSVLRDPKRSFPSTSCTPRARAGLVLLENLLWLLQEAAVLPRKVLPRLLGADFVTDIRSAICMLRNAELT